MVGGIAMYSKYLLAVILAALVVFVLGFADGQRTHRAAMIFSDGFESGRLTGWSYVMPSCGIGTRTPHIRVGTSQVRTGKYGVTVVASDSFNNAHWLEACELSDPLHNSYDLGQDQYYGASFRFPSAYTQPLGWGGLVAQLAYNGITSPAVGLALKNGGLRLLINGGNYNPTYHGTDGLCGSLASRGYPYTCNYPGDPIVNTIVANTWYDVIIHVTWSTRGTGVVEAWVREQGQTDFTKVLNEARVTNQTWETGVCDQNGNRPNGQPCKPFDKLGVYRDNSAGSQPDTVVDEDNFSYGTSYGVVRASFPTVATPASRRSRPRRRTWCSSPGRSRRLQTRSKAPHGPSQRTTRCRASDHRGRARGHDPPRVM
jgi:Polysaccharide lyase